MDPRTQERVEQWESRPFSGGYDGLADLADADFSGAVSGDGTWLFMLNGRIVGVFDGTIEAFEHASGTIYDAPDPALPLLCTMEERDGDTRAKYYTNDTPLREVDETLQDGSFTGYIELSENVLSGDYYAVYYGGRRMAAAYIGNAERLLTGEEAFERAADEVGIYEVIDVDIDVTDVPGTESSDSADSAGRDPSTDTGADSTDAGSATTSSNDSTSAEPSADPTESAVEPLDVSESGAGTETAVTEGPAESAESDAADVELTMDGVESAGAAGENTDADAGADRTDPSTGTATEDASPTGGPSDGERPVTSQTDRPDTVADSETDAADQSSSADEGDESGGSGPDPAEVEAAAEQLEQSDISWTKADDDPHAADSDGTGAAAASDESSEPADERFEEEAQWRETRSIPSIDPDNSETTGSKGGGSGGRSGSTQGRSHRSSETSSSSQTGSRQGAGVAQQRDPTGANRAARGAGSGSGSESAADATSDADQRVAELTKRIEKLESAREALAAKAEKLESERDQLRSKNEELSSTVERLQSRIEELESELAQARQSGDADGGSTATSTASTQLSPQRALDETNLFVRYASKSDPTLETAHEGTADQSEVAANLRLEHHTGFDADDVVVDGQPYETFLAETMEYRFVDWLTEMVLYEVRDTGNADGLGDLYDAIPRIDRAEFQATISLEDDDTEDVPDQVTFDVVAFDKRGNPLVVATLNDSRDPATQEMLEGMEEAASAVKANYPDLAAAMVVTSSYFEPGALEVAETATSGGILNRGSKLSYVNLSRKQGYHLCLVESRSEGFHMNVPDL